jgi:hypothetical protein
VLCTKSRVQCCVQLMSDYIHSEFFSSAKLYRIIRGASGKNVVGMVFRLPLNRLFTENGKVEVGRLRGGRDSLSVASMDTGGKSGIIA